MKRLLILSLLAACGGDDDGGGGGNVTPDAKVTIDAPAAKVTTVACPAAPAFTVMAPNAANSYAPMNTTVPVGGIVQFVMGSTHDVAPNPIAANSDPGTTVGFGGTKCLRFDAAGTYGFYCTTHSFAGTITVQ